MEIHVDDKYFELICCGRKKVEGRCGTDKYKGLKSGDSIIFVTESEGGGGKMLRQGAEVLEFIHYPSFQEMLLGEGLENCLPGIQHLEKGVEIYTSFPGYAQKEKEFGVVAIRFKIIL
jgi:ASC-1-like (ASCH) protein